MTDRPSSAGPGLRSRHVGWFLLGVAALRLLALWLTRADPVFRVPYLDGAFYHFWARSLAEGQGDFQSAYFLGPLYPHALALLYRIVGPEPFAARVAQSLLGVIDALWVLLIGRRLFGSVAGLAAAGLFALYGTLVFYEGLLVMESLLLTLILTAFGVLSLLPARTVLRGAVAGLLLGLATLGRGTVFLTAPVVWWMLSRSPAESSSGGDPVAVRRRPPSHGQTTLGVHRWRGVVVCVVAWLLVLAPVLVRNARLGAGPVLTTNAGVNFYAGNSADANGRFRQPPEISFFTIPVPDAARSQASLPPALAARALTVEAVAGSAIAAQSSLWFARARAWITREPGVFLQLLLRKVGLVFQGREIPQIESYSFHRQRMPVLRLFFVDFTLLWPLALLGAWHAVRKRSVGTWGVISFGVATLLPCVLFFVTARYRLSAVPYVTLMAGVGVATLVSWWKQRERGRLLLAAIVLLALAALTRVGAHAPAGAAAWENAQMAERVYALGDLDGAIAYQEAAARLLPERLEIQLNLALYWSERGALGDFERAERALLQLLQRNPDAPLLHFNLGTVFERQGKTEAARAAYERTLQLDPGDRRAREALRNLENTPTP